MIVPAPLRYTLDTVYVILIGVALFHVIKSAVRLRKRLVAFKKEQEESANTPGPINPYLNLELMKDDDPKRYR